MPIPRPWNADPKDPDPPRTPEPKTPPKGPSPLARFVFAFLATFATTVILGAQPAWAHTNICDGMPGNSCDAAQTSEGLAYAQIEVDWCLTPAGWTGIYLVAVRNTALNWDDRNFYVEIWKAQPNPTFLYQTSAQNLSYHETGFWNLAGLVHQSTGSEVYAKVIMLNGPGGDPVSWRLPAMHWPGHYPYIDTSRAVYGIGFWSC